MTPEVRIAVTSDTSQLSHLSIDRLIDQHFSDSLVHLHHVQLLRNC
jgi:hypothetical protein